MTADSKEQGQDSNDEGIDPIAQRVRTLGAQAAAAVAEKRTADAAAIISELQSLDDQILATADIVITRAMMNTACILLPAGQFDALEQLFVKVKQILWKHHQMATADWFVPLINLAALYDAKGDYRARAQTNSTIVAMADQLTAPLDEATSSIFIQLAQLYDQYGPPRAAAILYRQLHLHAMTSAEFGADTRLALIAQYAQALVADGQRDTAIAMCEQSLAALETQADFADDHCIQLLGLTAQLLQQGGNLDKVGSILERACDIAERSARTDSRAASSVYHNLASLYLRRGQREHYDKAERLLERAREIVAKNGPLESSEYAGEVAQLATVVAAKGEVDRANALYREAFRLYEAASDTNLQDFAGFLTDAGFLNLKHGRPAAAVGVFERARLVRESMGNVHPLQLATALSNLATAQFESHDYANAIQNYRHAIEVRHQCQEFLVGK